MGELFFIAKSLFLTIVIITLMQVKVGETTVEEKALHWIESSPIVLPIQEVATGGIKALREVWKVVFGNLNSRFWQTVDKKNMPGKRDLNLSLSRSEEFLREQAKKLKMQAEEAAKKAAQSAQDSLENSATEQSSQEFQGE